jgi:undecaprenyl-diphosphatase
MAESPEASDQPERTPEEERAAEALERGIAEVDTPADASQVLDSLEQSTAGLSEEEVARTHPGASPEEQAAALEKAARVAPSARPAKVITTAAVQSASAAPDTESVVDAATVQAVEAGVHSGRSVAALRGRRLLRHELFRRLRPLQAVDAIAFVQLNQLPHTRETDRFMSRLSWAMTGGTGWLLVLLLAAMCDRQRGWNAARVVVPALCLATVTVEYPIKRWFRRRRPFIALVEAIIVGRKPGSYSFPSGHSAAAFAGALLLTRQYPGGKRAFFGLASLVAFSRVYLGAHYPGDVVTGSFLGMVLARIYSRLLRKIGASRKS